MIRFEKRLGQDWKEILKPNEDRFGFARKLMHKIRAFVGAEIPGLLKAVTMKFRNLVKSDRAQGKSLALSRSRVSSIPFLYRYSGKIGQKRFGTGWNTYLFFILFALTSAASVIMGCRATPFNPESKAYVTKFSPELLHPTVVSGGTYTLPVCQVDVTVYNEIPLHLKSYVIDYFGPDGTKITAPDLSVSANLSRFIKPTAGAETATLDTEIYTEALYEHISQGTPTDVSDDINPVTAIITFTGEDENGNPITCNGSVEIDTMSE